MYLGILTPIVFWGTLIICGLMTDNYSHLTNMVSELGTIGTKTQYIFTTGLVVSSFLSLLFIIGLFRIAKKNQLSTIPILLILTFTFSIFGAAIFPLPLSLHGILGSPSLLLPLSPLLVFIFWGNKIIPDIKKASGLIFLIMALGFLTLTTVMDNYFGLKQRFFHIGWTLWFIYLCNMFLRLNRSLLKTNKVKH